MNNYVKLYDYTKIYVEFYIAKFYINMIFVDILVNTAVANYEGPQIEGSTACVALIRGNQIIVGNVGDSRCVLSRNGQAIDLSTDHKPNEAGERARIEAAGGSVVQREVLVFDALGRMRIELGAYRVDGIIAVSRALGDFQFKKNNKLKFKCDPDIPPNPSHATPGLVFLLRLFTEVGDMTLKVIALEEHEDAKEHRYPMAVSLHLVDPVSFFSAYCCVCFCAG
ncbi:hypothetical protein QYE76_068327 [Lolium multiflorum]|uniref:protein-serine/threonine phosphatase n=1 Tax=Lolium multiflorum TaxID=4521 RepID=A0AAD8WDV2_LOLMU|nr:hypothetical protein QYE76_068327 [Lolium multiflorum]